MLSLRCPAQNYAWGRPAEKSEVTWQIKVWVRLNVVRGAL
jgi:hypothetical protein